MAGLLSALSRLYLSLYNWTVFLGWFQVLYLALKTLSESGHQHVYNVVERPLLLAQSAAVLEIVHGLVGLVRSPITATLLQIGSRLYLTWGILWSFPKIIRYSFFGMKEALGFAPSWLLWLRYSTFILLYPTGITSEVGLIYIALPHMKNSEKYFIRMPNKWSFCFDYFYAAIVALGIYVPGSPHMYGYMLDRGRKLLQKPKGSRRQQSFNRFAARRLEAGTLSLKEDEEKIGNFKKKEKEREGECTTHFESSYLNDSIFCTS